MSPFQPLSPFQPPGKHSATHHGSFYRNRGEGGGVGTVGAGERSHAAPATPIEPADGRIRVCFAACST